MHSCWCLRQKAGCRCDAKFELITYGLKGLSAYSKHANVLLQEDGEVDAFLQRALSATLDNNLSADDLVALTLETGKYGVSGMALLDVNDGDKM